MPIILVLYLHFIKIAPPLLTIGQLLIKFYSSELGILINTRNDSVLHHSPPHNYYICPYK